MAELSFGHNLRAKVCPCRGIRRGPIARNYALKSAGQRKEVVTSALNFLPWAQVRTLRFSVRKIRKMSCAGLSWRYRPRFKYRGNIDRYNRFSRRTSQNARSCPSRIWTTTPFQGQAQSDTVLFVTLTPLFTKVQLCNLPRELKSNEVLVQASIRHIPPPSSTAVTLIRHYRAAFYHKAGAGSRPQPNGQ